MRSRTVTLPVVLTRGTGRPLAVQLASQVRELISHRALEAGGRLPSSRALAADLSVSRAVVEQAYDQLIAEGWVEARRGAGTFVASLGTPGRAHAASSGRGRPSPERTPTTAHAGDALVQLDTGTPWVDSRHDSGWRRAWREVSASRMPRGYTDPAGEPELRAEIAAYVARTRGVVCDPDDVVVTNGTTHGLGLLLAALPTGALAVEDPGYRAAVATARYAGWRTVDVPVDDEGLEVDALRQLPERDVHAVYVTPAHQHPFGMTMSGPRRLALLAEARRRSALVVEDDYDSEFRYDVAPLPALANLDRERVAYLGTSSKMVQPGLRIGWLVVEPALAAGIVEQRAARHDHPPWPVQRALLCMFRDGHIDRLVRSARRVYAERGRRVARVLMQHGRIRGSVAGMYVTLALPAEVAERVRGDAARQGFGIASVSDYCRSSRHSGIVLGFGGVTDAELDRALDVVDSSLARHAGRALSSDGDVSQWSRGVLT